MQAKFTCFKQSDGLVVSKGIATEKDVDLKIQCTALKQLATGMFDNSPAHYFVHTLAVEYDHLFSLLKIVTLKYLGLRFKTHGKRFRKMIVHRDQPSL